MGGACGRVPAGGVWRWGLPYRLPSTQAKPSRHGTGRLGRSSSWALHLDARHRACFTVCGSTADGMGVEVAGGAGTPRSRFSPAQYAPPVLRTILLINTYSSAMGSEATPEATSEGPLQAGDGQAPREITSFDFKKHASEARDAYEKVHQTYQEFAGVVQSIISTCLSNSGINTHSVEGRAKSIEGFHRKAEKESPENPNSPRYSDPLAQITDLAGVRVITYFLNMIQEVESVVSDEFEVIERIDKSEAFEKDQRLGYQSLHLLVKLKGNRYALPEYARFADLTAEIQVRTILQHAWAEIEHDIQYKAVYTLPSETKRRFMALAGALEIADREFQAIAKTDRKLRDAALKSVAEGRLSGVEITPEALKAYLDKRYGADGRMSDYSYAYTVRLLKRLGFTDLDELSDFLTGYDHDKISRTLYGSRQGQLTRFEDVLLVAAGREFLNRHPWGNRPGNEWFASSIEHRLKRAEEAGFSVGDRRLPNRQDDSGKG
ncbi:hypothetical protein DDE05_25260 [Streptomyces cavourensis]|nr:hypothetical protein DDE05_25260 [Streptomyces cavourensis]